MNSYVLYVKYAVDYTSKPTGENTEYMLHNHAVQIDIYLLTYCNCTGASSACGSTKICAMARRRRVRRLKTTCSHPTRTSWSDTLKCGALKCSRQQQHPWLAYKSSSYNSTPKFAQ